MNCPYLSISFCIALELSPWEWINLVHRGLFSHEPHCWRVKVIVDLIRCRDAHFLACRNWGEGRFPLEC